MRCTRATVTVVLLLLASLPRGVAFAAETGAPAPAAPAPAAAAPAPAAAAPAAAAPAPAPAAPAPAAAAVTPSENTSAAIRLRRLEQRVQTLKEQAWRVKARVGMLKEAVLGGGIGARAQVVHQNKMGGSFKLIKLIYALDGSQVFVRNDDSGQMNDQKTLNILSGPIAPGNHTVSVLMQYRGDGYGLFAYLRQYKFTVRSSHTFTASEGKMTQITCVGF